MAGNSYETNLQSVVANSGQSANSQSLINSSLSSSNGTDPFAGTNFTDGGSDLLGDFGKGAAGVSSLANVYLGFQNLDIAKDQLGILKDQWKMSKQELQYMQGSRERISAQYMGRAAPQQQAEYQANAPTGSKLAS